MDNEISLFSSDDVICSLPVMLTLVENSYSTSPGLFRYPCSDYKSIKCPKATSLTVFQMMRPACEEVPKMCYALFRY